MASRQVRPLAFCRPVTTVIGVALLVGFAFLYIAPALRHGTSLGPFDFLSTFGLTATPNVKPYNLVALDQILQGQPWTALDWTQVHSAHLPLWNPYSAMGTPLAFNFQSAPFSLPALVGYLVPVRYAYTVGVLVKMIVAGTGVMFLCRVLRLSNLASVFAGAVFELSGAFTGWLGWPQATAMSFLGWVIAATVLLLERRPGQSRAQAVALLALALALSIYAGHPESMVMIFGAVAVVALVYLAAAVVRLPQTGDGERRQRPPYGDDPVGGVRPWRRALTGTRCPAVVARSVGRGQCVTPSLEQLCGHSTRSTSLTFSRQGTSASRSPRPPATGQLRTTRRPITWPSS